MQTTLEDSRPGRTVTRNVKDGRRKVSEKLVVPSSNDKLTRVGCFGPSRRGGGETTTVDGVWGG